MSSEEIFRDLQNWLETNGGSFHPQVHLKQVASGFAVVAATALPPDSQIVACPFSLAITKELALENLGKILGPSAALQNWSARQLISCYLCFHSIIADGTELSSHLLHFPYIKSLPARDKLRTTLHFTSDELGALKGSNLFGATADRERDWRAEWDECRTEISRINHQWGIELTWERFLTAATHLSSRAFPSTLLSRSLSPGSPLTSDENSEPILLPGIDSLNHARGVPVSWVQSYSGDGHASSISLVLHTPTAEGAELFNNYGAKPNSELILGYGFTLENNPDDTIVLKIGGMGGKRWEVGRGARGAEDVWATVLERVKDEAESEETYEDYLNAAEAFEEMVWTLAEKLPPAPEAEGMREDVRVMVTHYLEGQRAILNALIQFAQAKEAIGLQMARDQGIEVVTED